MHLFFILWQVLPTLVHVPFIAIVTKRIIISNYSYNKICDKHTVDMLLPLNTIDEFLITRFVYVKMVQYKDFTHLRTYHCENSKMAIQTHRHIIVLFHQVIMII
jgi:hypothetical protein